MLKKPDIRHQVLRDAVAFNVALRKGERWAPRERRRSAAVGRWLVVMVVAALAATSWAFLKPVEPLPAAAPGAASPLPAASADPAFSGRWTANQPVVTSLHKIDPSVLPLSVHHVVVDPGHGGEDYGTIGGGLAEKQLTLDIAQRLAALLERNGFEVTMTRDDDRFLSLRERTEVANRSDGDVFVSIHINWIAARQVRGVETYIVGTTEDPELNALARLENRHSGYSLADQDRLIQGILKDALRMRSQNLAERVHGSLYSSLLPVNPRLQDRGVKTAPFVVLVSTRMPAVLAEVSCLSNDQEAELLARPLYREHIAEALYRGLRKYSHDVHQDEEKGS